MAEIELYAGSFTGAQIDSAISKVLNPDSSPDASHTGELITSAGVAGALATAYPILSDAFSINGGSSGSKAITSDTNEIYFVIAFRTNTGIMSGWFVNYGGYIALSNNNASITLSVSSGTITITNSVTQQIRVKVIRLA